MKFLKALLWICTFPVSLLFWPLRVFRKETPPLFETRVGENIKGFGLPGEPVHYSAEGPLIARHFKLADAVESAWKMGERGKILAAIKAHISIATQVIKVLEEEARLNGEDYLPTHSGFTRLAMLHEKEKNFSEAIRTCEAAISQGWSADEYQHRLERCKTKLMKSIPQP